MKKFLAYVCKPKFGDISLLAFCVMVGILQPLTGWVLVSGILGCAILFALIQSFEEWIVKKYNNDVENLEEQSIG